MAADSEPKNQTLRLPEWCLVINFISLAPLLAVHAMHLWERPHFQFFPLAWTAFAVLVYQRAQLSWTTLKGRYRLGFATWLIGLVVGLGGAYLFSPWLGMVSIILSIAGWGIMRLGQLPLMRWFAWLLILAVTLPLPGNLDTQFINRLQTLSSQSAGDLLDLFGVLHLRQGNLIEVQSKELFVDEACSGIDSFYALTAIALLMIVWQRKPLVVSALALLTVPVWTWFGNLLRLMVIVWMLDRFSIDLSHGWKHTLLGLVTFAIASGGLFATLDAMTQLFKRFSSSTIPRDRKWWHLAYNAVVYFPAKAPKLVDEEEQYYDGRIANANVAAPSSEKEVQAYAPKWLSLALILVAPSLGTLGLSLKGFFVSESINLPHIDKARVDSAFVRTAMPDSLVGAKLVDFRGQERSPDNYFGEHSRLWLYQDDAKQFTLSVDFPFRGFHGLWLCYTNAGNKVEDLPVYFAADGRERAYARVKFRDDLGNPSYLWFNNFDASGKPIEMEPYEPNATEVVGQRLRPVLEKLQDQPVTYQFQLYIQPGYDLTQEELNRYQRVFNEALPYAVKQVQQLNAK